SRGSFGRVRRRPPERGRRARRLEQGRVVLPGRPDGGRVRAASPVAVGRARGRLPRSLSARERCRERPLRGRGVQRRHVLAHAALCRLPARPRQARVVVLLHAESAGAGGTAAVAGGARIGGALRVRESRRAAALPGPQHPGARGRLRERSPRRRADVVVLGQLRAQRRSERGGLAPLARACARRRGSGDHSRCGAGDGTPTVRRAPGALRRAVRAHARRLTGRALPRAGPRPNHRSGSANVMYRPGPGSGRSSACENRPLPPTAIVTYWRPSTSYTAGTPSVAAGRSYSQSTSPVSTSRARNLRSDDVPTKSTPPAVTTGPPRGAWLPVLRMPRSARNDTSPFGTCHMIVPVFRSYAVSCDHGGPIAERPLLCSMKSFGTVYGTKSSSAFGGGCVAAPAAPCGPPPASRSSAVVGSSFETTNSLPANGSTATLPQFAPPLWPGIITVPRRLGGVYRPSLRYVRKISRTFSRSSSGMYGLMSASVNVSRANGGGAVGIGCVGDACSPGASDAGTGRSSTGQRGSPVTRSNT